MSKPFLFLQLRPEDEAADEEFASMLKRGGLDESRAHRLRLDQHELPADLALDDYAGVIVGGGPGCVSDPPEAKTPAEARIEAAILGLMPAITARDFPFLGCCYGIGILGHHLGGVVSKDHHGESVSAITVSRMPEGDSDPLMAGLPAQFTALVGHKEALDVLPPGVVQLASGTTCPYQIIRAGRHIYATQFHPEASGASFALRIRVYRDKGYFRPEEADALIAHMQDVDTTASGLILRNFIRHFGG